MEMKSVFGDRKKVWSIAALAVLCALAFVLLFKYDFGNFQRRKKSIVENARNKAILDSLAEYKKYLKKFKTYLAPDNGRDWLIGTLAVVSKNNGVILSAVKPLESELSSEYSISKVSIEGVSSYKSLMRLIADLEDSKECVIIDSISMKSIDLGAGRETRNLLEVIRENVPRDKPVSFKAVIACIGRGT